MSEKVSLTPDQAIAHAATHLQHGRPDEAQRIGEMILQAVPSHPGALNLLGLIHLENNRLDEAIDNFRTSLKSKNDAAGVWWNLAQAYCRQGRLDDEISALEKLLEIKPDQDAARTVLIDRFVQTGALDKAFDHLAMRLKEKSDDQCALILEHKISLETGRYVRANRALKKLQEILPEDDSLIKIELGNLLLSAGFPGRAKKFVEEVLANEPDNVRALWLKGQILERSGMPELGVKLYEQVIKRTLLTPAMQIELISTYIDLGEKEKAKGQLDQLIRQQPNGFHHFNLLAQVQENGLTPQQVEHVKRIQAQIGEEALINESFEYALAYTEEKAKNYDACFQHYRKANGFYKANLERQKRGYHRTHVEQSFAQTKKFFNEELFEEFKGYGSASTLPVFIVGMPRSGTTLTERILGSHSRVEGVGELMDIPHLHIIIRELAKSKKPFPFCLQDLDKKYIKVIADSYVQRLRDWEPGADMVVNKLPGNFSHLGLIRILFPNAKIIHCMRDPKDTLISCFFARFSPGLSFSFDLDDCAHQYEQYWSLMEHWDAHLPGGMYHSFYGDLVTEPEEAARKLLAYCGLKWEENCLNFHQSKKAVRTASRLQVRQPIYKSSLERWRRFEGQIDEIMHLSLPEDYQRSF